MHQALPRLNTDTSGLKCTTLSGGSAASEDENSEKCAARACSSTVTALCNGTYTRVSTREKCEHTCIKLQERSPANAEVQQGRTGRASDHKVILTPRTSSAVHAAPLCTRYTCQLLLRKSMC